MDSGDVHPVILQAEELNVDSVVNNGVFLCMIPGYYHFSASFSAQHSNNKIGFNQREMMYARGDDHMSGYAETMVKLEMYESYSMMYG